MNKLLLMLSLMAFPTMATAAPEDSKASSLSFNVQGLADNGASSQTSSMRFAAPAADAETPILNPPSGSCVDYVREGMTYVVMMGMAFSNPDSASAVSVIDGDDGYVYINHPYASIVTNSWLKGKREDDRIVVSLPQLVYQVADDGEVRNYYAYRMELLPDDNETGYWYFPTESQELVYYIDGDGFYMEGNGEETFLFGLCDSEGGWTGHGDMTQKYERFDGVLVTPPAGIMTEDWQARSGAMAHHIVYASDGNDVYVKGLAKEFAESWITGNITAEGVFFPSGQYLGVDPATQHYNFLSGNDKEPFWSEEYEMEFMRNVLADNIMFQKDGETLWIESNVLVNKGMTSYNPLVTYVGFELKPLPSEVAPYPANPELSTLISYDSAWGYGVFMFNLPALNMDGYMLPTDEMSYMIYIDGEPFPLYSDEYPGIEDETYLIPYNYNDDNFIKSFGVAHHFYFFIQDFDTIGVQSVYEKDGEYFGSQLVYYDLSGSVVTTVEKDIRNEVSVEWYDLSGRRLSAPEGGICLKLTKFDDGSVKTEKIVARGR